MIIWWTFPQTPFKDEIMKINKNKHIWEGWTVGDFIEHLEMFPTHHLKTKQQVKEWCKNNQPYYKRHIPMVYNYFVQKLGL